MAAGTIMKFQRHLDRYMDTKGLEGHGARCGQFGGLDRNGPKAFSFALLRDDCKTRKISTLLQTLPLFSAM